jgi:hypothetical protein
MPQIDRRYRDIVARYEDCLARYGDNRLGVDWPRREDAELGYAVMLDRDRDEPFFNTAPCVVRDGEQWLMWYVSFTGWDEIHGHPEPMSNVKYAGSDDGVHWRRTGIVCVDYDADAQAIGRPWVVRLEDRYGMWFSYRGPVDYRTDPKTSYRVGYAEDSDGCNGSENRIPPDWIYRPMAGTR